MNNAILIGMPGSGKSTVGVLLAKALGYDFIDTDLTLQQQEGALLQDILTTHGTDGLLDLERDCICALHCKNSVISPGGSCISRDASMAHLKSLGTIIYLSLPFEQVEARIQNINTRGIAMAPGQTLHDLYRIRTPLYRRWADITINCSDQTLEETVAAVLGGFHHKEGLKE